MTVIILLVRELHTSEDGQKMARMKGCVSLKKILLLITTPFFLKSLRKETPFHFSPGRGIKHRGFSKPEALQAV